jgi:ribosomal protein S17E
MRQVFRAYRDVQRYMQNPLDMQSIAELNSITMNEQDYERIKKDIARALEQAQAEYKKQMDALEIIWELEKGKQPPAKLLDSITWSDMAKQVIPTLQEPFTRYELEKAVLEQFPDFKNKWRKNSLGGILTRMISRKEIEVVVPGSGPKPARYKLKRQPETR